MNTGKFRAIALVQVMALLLTSFFALNPSAEVIAADYYIPGDVDDDGIPDGEDNCPDLFNPGQEDSDYDGVGDFCDICPDHYNPGQEDFNGDGIGDACQPDKHIIVHAQYDLATQDRHRDQIDGSSWDTGSTVTMTIDDVSNGPGVDLVFTQVAHETDIELITVSFYLEDYDLKPGDLVTMSDGTVTKTHVVQPQEITFIDVDTDVVAGTAPEGSRVLVWFEYPGFREEIIDVGPSGTWSVDFSTYGLDVAYGSGGAAVMNNPLDDSSHTRYNWEFKNHIESSLTQDQIGFFDYTPFSTISLEIYDHFGGSLIREEDVPTDGNGEGFIDMWGETDLVPGVYIIAKDQATNLVKDQVLSYLSLDEWQPELGRVFGLADPGQEVQVNVYHEGYEGPDEYVTWVEADENGEWEAIFPETFSGDMLPAAFIFDEDRDETVAKFILPKLEANITGDWMMVHQFTPNSSTTLDIYEYEGGPYLGTVVIGTDSHGEGGVENFEHPFDLVPGMFLVITDDATSKVKELVLTDIGVSQYDVDADWVLGYGPPEVNLQVHVHDEELNEGFGQEVMTDINGDWVADFSGIADIRYQHLWSGVSKFDEDGDSTCADWLGLPIIEASLTYDWINLFGFEPASEVLLTIDGTEFQVMTFEDGNFWMDRYEHMVNLVPGLLITADQGHIHKELVLSDVGILDVNLDTDQVSGYGPIDADIEVNAWNEGGGYGFGEMTVVDSEGYWTVTFSEDITEEFGFGAVHRDEDYDGTIGEIPEAPFFMAGPQGEYIQAVLWPIGSEIILTIPSESFSQSATVEQAEFDPFTGFVFFDLGGVLDIVPGMEIFVEGSGFAKGHVVRDISITDYDLDMDQVMGTGSPGATIFIAIVGPNGEWLEVQRWVTADLSGNWIADFSVPGPGKGEENVYDIQTGDHGFAQELDEDGDGTEIGWRINTPPVLGEIIAPFDPVEVNSQVVLTAPFFDPDIEDSWHAICDWGDGIVTEGAIEDFVITCVHPYDVPDVYTVMIEVIDAAGASDQGTYQYIVAYDPDGGFLTGGGWVWSPEGAYLADPTLSGKVTFGFVSKYKRKADAPEGNTELQFHAADLNFKATSYDWLIIVGDRAQYMGQGTINGEGTYKFMIAVIDGDISSGMPDRFRMKIWTESDGVETVIYDLQFGEPISATPVTELDGGSIVIHEK